MTAPSIATSSELELRPVTAVSSPPMSIQAMSVALPAGFPVKDRRVPLAIEKEQEYYWTSEWQDGVREAVAELVTGEFVLFDSDDPADVARWLLEAEE